MQLIRNWQDLLQLAAHLHKKLLSGSSFAYKNQLTHI